jgi:hypothetical protein
MSEMRLRLLTQRDQKNVALRVVLRPERTHETTDDEDLANAFFTEKHAALRIEPSRARSGILESQRDQATLRHREARRSTVAENSQFRAAPIALANSRVLRHRRVTADQAARTLEHFRGAQSSRTISMGRTMCTVQSTNQGIWSATNE